jgi:hypothetical protein
MALYPPSIQEYRFAPYLVKWDNFKAVWKVRAESSADAAPGCRGNKMRRPKNQQKRGRGAGQGMQFIAIASELRMMNQKAQEFLKVLRPGDGGKDSARY